MENWFNNQILKQKKKKKSQRTHNPTWLEAIFQSRLF